MSTARHEYDHDMVCLARDRGRVLVTSQGVTRRATLVAWEPKRGERRLWGKARVQYASGATATVRMSEVTVLDPDTPVIETRRCRECGREFNLADRIDAEEWAFGHDCEA